MLQFKLLEDAEGFELSGGQLTEPLRYENVEAVEYVTRMVGYLSQVEGSELRIYGPGDAGLVETKKFRAGIRPGKGELGNV